MNVASYIDHTLLKPDATRQDIQKVCEEARDYLFMAVCVPPCYVRFAKKMLDDTAVKVATVAGFPMGYSAMEAKQKEVQIALGDGADEIDVVLNLTALKNGDWDYLKAEADALLKPVHQQKKVLKVIIESGLLTDNEIISCCELYAVAGVDFLKTSTGFTEKGASAEAVELMRRHLPASVLIKASGGIRSYKQAKAMIDAGASRLGCSAGIKIVNGANSAVV